MKRYGSSVPLAVLLAAACAPSHNAGSPVPEPGDRVRYSTAGDSARLYVGQTVRMSGDTIVIDRLVRSTGGGPGDWSSAAFTTSSLGRLDMRVGRRGHTGRGALIGAGAGALLGMACASEDAESSFQVGAASCFFGYTLFGVGTGALIGTLIRSDVWKPVLLPLERSTLSGDSRNASASFGIGIRVSTRGPR